jgi:hypothetical protein
MTAVANTAFTAAQFNTYVRDNLLETAPAIASAAGQMFVSDGANSIAARTPSFATVATSESTTSTTYADLTTVGPSVTVQTGTSAIVAISSWVGNATTNIGSAFTYAVSGATTLSPSSNWGCVIDGVAGGNQSRLGVVHMRNDLNPGTNTFVMKYLTQAGSSSPGASFNNRHLVVIPL